MTYADEKLAQWYAQMLEKAREFTRIVQLVEACPLLGKPSGVSASHLKWIAQVDDVIYRANVCRLVNTIDTVVFSIRRVSKDIDPALRHYGFEVWSKTLKIDEVTSAAVMEFAVQVKAWFETSHQPRCETDSLDFDGVNEEAERLASRFAGKQRGVLVIWAQGLRMRTHTNLPPNIALQVLEQTRDALAAGEEADADKRH